jgi:hypothetical protein
MLGFVVEGLARKRRVVVSRTSSCVITPLRLRSNTLHRNGNTWRRRRVHIPWGCSACSWRGRYRSCIGPGPAGAARRWYHRGKQVVYLGEEILRDLLDLLAGEHAAVLDTVRALESVVHSFKLLDRYIRGRLDRVPTNQWRFATAKDCLPGGCFGIKGFSMFLDAWLWPWSVWGGGMVLVSTR